MDGLVDLEMSPNRSATRQRRSGGFETAQRNNERSLTDSGSFSNRLSGPTISCLEQKSTMPVASNIAMPALDTRPVLLITCGTWQSWTLDRTDFCIVSRLLALTTPSRPSTVSEPAIYPTNDFD
nr:hypothetical protein P9270_028240 [Mesorhizobium sp. WSM4875]